MQMAGEETCRVIAEIVIELAHKLRLRSVAEGVEDEATLATLVGLGCDLAQGYHFSRPVDAHRMPALVRQFDQSQPAATADHPTQGPAIVVSISREQCA
jgi:EAL domain-containing protein (putative c-di-GMP-specific phosphodiesterase class I)